MNELDVLTFIKTTLQKQELEGNIFSSSEDSPVNKIITLINITNKQAPNTLEISVEKQTTPTTEGLFRIQFLAQFPFKLVEGASFQMSGVIALINRFLDLPGFELSEAEDILRFRHVLLVTDKGLDSTLLLTIVGVVMMVTDIYANSLYQIAIGKLTYNELLEQTLKLSK